MKKRNAFFLFSLFLLFACNSTTAKPEEALGADTVQDAQVPKTVSDIEPLLFGADSLQVIYYDNPGGDSLRYTRYFTLTESADTARIKSFVKEINGVYVQEPKGRPCRSEGKLYFFKGQDILKTVYFSARGGSCTYFYFIKDGTFVYFPMTETALAWLKAGRQKARKPGP